MPAKLDTVSYLSRRGEIERYFDDTAAEAWRQLTSQAPLGRIRASVRAGRDEMRRVLVDWLPRNLHGCRVLDAGCGTGALAVELAQRGASVTAVDLSTTLVALARDRLPARVAERIHLVSGDMSSPELGAFHYAVAMDSLIHYARRDAVEVLAALAPRVSRGMLITHVPVTPLLTVKRALGRCFPRTERAPDVRPCRLARLHAELTDRLGAEWRLAAHQRVASGFYTSQALRLERQ